MPPLGLYIHVPFCGSICHYCNFNRGLFDEALKQRYVEAVRREIACVAERLAAGMHPVTGGPLSGRAGREADTIYFGGGTPSLLPADEIAQLIETCRSEFAVADAAEVTLEANPETVTRERMADYRAAGVNRVSMGVQSFRDEELRRLGRVHDAARAIRAYGDTRAAGLNNISLDLMLWLPQQTVANCLESVRTLAALSPDHASLYLLELYPNSPLKEEMARAEWSLAPEDDAADMYLETIDTLRQAGYGQYEISNFARPGFESRHNLKYWTDGEWAAFGCGAHSTIEGIRWKNVSATESYVTTIAEHGMAVAEERRLTRAEQLQEAVFMGLRLVEGVNLLQIRDRYGVDLWQHYGERLAPFEDAGLLVREVSRRVGEPTDVQLRLTPRGLLLSNEIMTVFMDDLGTLK